MGLTAIVIDLYIHSELVSGTALSSFSLLMYRLLSSLFSFSSPGLCSSATWVIMELTMAAVAELTVSNRLRSRR